ncbi:AAA-like domain-containing protein [Chamaesiphon sp. OTE_8_metabat_110]|uniref:WD40 domain-containing protein n=1 Tax=Chamaesiphon sp. OTE_8_metabat_110 TaxID=2964696 RepID=UPI00286BC216|nr:AAA-like domain-containing protein [Chamaesiphon sp. OTE_8_metabat_110]
MVENEPYEYRVGGSLPEYAPSYVIRQADRDFYAGLKAGDFCYVFNSRQMGKTSLLVRTLHRLRSEGVACTTIDVSGRGSGNIQPEQWYAGIAYTLIKDFKLANPLQFMKSWWLEREFLSPSQRLAELIETVLLPETTVPITIFIDEIDSTLSRDFSTDDFFALIRSCYDRRSINPDYNRLTFALIGVATPSNLINDKRRTPFNIGRAIELSGFTIAEATPLAVGLRDLADDPQAVLAQILHWTGGQPFLTQKLCYLLVKQNKFIHRGDPKTAIDRLVTAELITDWESKDNPTHFKTIATRLTANEMRSGSLLGLYQQALDRRGITSGDRTEEQELQLSGIVVKVGDRLQVSNAIYATIFDLEWVDKQLANLRPYGAALAEWLESNKQDKSRLLRGKALAEALIWSTGKSLSNLDDRFLSACREQRSHEANQEILQQRIKQLWSISGIAILWALCALFLGAEARREKENAQVATITAKNALNQALIKSDTSKNTLETLVGTLEATQLFQAQKQLLSKAALQQLQLDIKTNLQYAIHGTLERNRLKHNNTVTGVSYSPNGKFIASVSKDNTLKIWQPNGLLLRSIPHPHALMDLAIDRDSQKIVTVGDNPQVRVWNPQGQKLTPSLERRNSSDKFIRVAITPDSQYIAAATNTDSQDAEVIIWKVSSGKIVKILKFPDDLANPSDRTHSFRDLKFSTDGRYLTAASTDTTIKVWDWQTNLSPKILRGHQDWVYSISFSRDGKWLVSSGGGSDKSLKVWEIMGDKFQLKKTVNLAHNDAFFITFNPNNRQLATVGSGDSTLKLWDFDRILASPTVTLTMNELGNILLTTIVVAQSAYKGLDYSPDGSRIALAAANYQVTLWEPDPALERNTSASQFAVQKVIYSPSGKYLATTGSDKTIKIWQANGTLIKTINAHKDWIYGLSFSPDETSIASASEDNTIKIWNWADGSLVRTLKHDNFAYDVSYSPDARYLASVGDDGKLKIWNVKDGKLLKEFSILNNDHWTWKVTFSPDGRYLAVITSAGVELHRTTDFKTVRILNDRGQKPKTLRQINFSPDGRTIAAAGIDGMVRLWDVDDGKLLNAYQGHRESIVDIQFSHNSQEIATAGDDGTIKFWSRNGELRRTLEGFNGLSLAFSPDSKTFIAVNRNGVMRFWNLTKLERAYLSLEDSYTQGCQQLQEYQAHYAAASDLKTSLATICKP